MIEIVRCTSENLDFINLVDLLDADLAERDGEDHAFYHQFNSIDMLRHTIVLFENDKAVGCGALKETEPKVMEIKRMYTLPDYRGKGYATIILHGLENWAAEMSYEKCVLETGKRQPEAIQLYKKKGYKVIPNYRQYAGIANSICFEKNLK